MRADASEGARHNGQTIDVRAVVGDCVGNRCFNLGLEYRRNQGSVIWHAGCRVDVCDCSVHDDAEVSVV